MKLKIVFLYLVVFLQIPCFAKEGIAWVSFDKDIFANAKAQKKLVLLDLKANWCHWCHVMDDSTYSNKEVIDYLNEHYISAEADQDKRPDLANKYRDYGWPATIIFDANGNEIVKRSGYLSPKNFLRLLKAVVADPSPEEESFNYAALQPDSSSFAQHGYTELLKKFNESLDYKLGGFDFYQKYVDYDTYEYGLHHAKQDSALNHWVQASITNSANGIFDEVWGGVYQYSTNSDWHHEHFEKLLSVQSRYIKMYCWYYKTYHQQWALQKAEKIAEYCNRFLKAESGGFYNAQDADVVQGKHSGEYFKLTNEQRLKVGMPAIDKNIFTNVNAQLSDALVVLWASSGKQEYLTTASATINYLEQHAGLPEGGFRHTEKDYNGIVSLSDNLYMAMALNTLYRATADKNYLKKLTKLATFIDEHYSTKYGAYLSYYGNTGLAAEPVISENINLCRFFNLYSHVSGYKTYKTKAEKIFSFLTTPAIVDKLSTEPGILTAYDELSKEPLTATFLIYKKNEDAESSLRETIAYPDFYFLNNTYFSQDQVPADKKDMFSSFDSNVLFFCTSSYCSMPITSLSQTVKTLYKNKP